MPKGKELNLKSKRRYDPDLPRKMYLYFIEGDWGGALPSFSKFARLIGVTLEELTSYRSRKKFDSAYRECEAIRRDAIVDGALSKRLDSSFAKFLLSDAEEKDTDGVEVTLRVIEG
jgi:hypothetical protein